MVRVTNPELVALVNGALDDLGAGPGVLADWLEERGNRRGVLLRRRWQRWQSLARELAEAEGGGVAWMAGTFRYRLDTNAKSFRKYLQALLWELEPGAWANPESR